MKFLSVIGAVWLLSGCVTSLENYQETGVETNIQAMQFNSILSQYRPRPTFLSLVSYDSGERILMLQMSRYSSHTAQIPFYQNKVSNYVAMIDKFIKWSKLAEKKGDVFTKDIGQVDKNMAYVKFTFHSANKSSQYLSLSYCAKNNLIADVCFDGGSINLTPREAIKLKYTLIRFSAGEIKADNIDKMYN